MSFAVIEKIYGDLRFPEEKQGEMTKHSSGVFIPAWAFTVLASFLMVSLGAAATYFRFTSFTEARLERVEADLKELKEVSKIRSEEFRKLEDKLDSMKDLLTRKVAQ